MQAEDKREAIVCGKAEPKTTLEAIPPGDVGLWWTACETFELLVRENFHQLAGSTDGQGLAATRRRDLADTTGKLRSRLCRSWHRERRWNDTQHLIRKTSMPNCNTKRLEVRRRREESWEEDERDG